MAEAQFITRKEFAKLLGVSVSTLDRMRRAKKIPAPSGLWSSPKWSRIKVDSWIRKQSQK